VEDRIKIGPNPAGLPPRESRKLPYILTSQTIPNPACTGEHSGRHTAIFRASRGRVGQTGACCPSRSTG